MPCIQPLYLLTDGAAGQGFTGGHSQDSLPGQAVKH